VRCRNALNDAPLPAERLTAGTPRNTCAKSKWRAGGFARPTIRITAHWHRNSRLIKNADLQDKIR
jgi:hypothetical protein